MRLSPGGKSFALAETNTIRVLDFATGRDLVPTGGHRDVIQAVAFSPDGRVAATAGYYGTVRPRALARYSASHGSCRLRNSLHSAPSGTEIPGRRVLLFHARA